MSPASLPSPISPLSLPDRFMLLCSTFGILDMLVSIRPLQLILNLYIALLAGLACALEIKSTWLRDHLTLGLERHCALLRFATGEG